MGRRFAIGRALDGEIARLAPPLYCGHRETSVSIVVGQDFGLGFRRFGKTVFQNPCYFSMQLAASAAQERLICGVTHECMLEDVACGGRRGMRKNKLGCD